MSTPSNKPVEPETAATETSSEPLDKHKSIDLLASGCCAAVLLVTVREAWVAARVDQGLQPVVGAAGLEPLATVPPRPLAGIGVTAGQAGEINTRATQVRMREKINTRTTRTKRHSPAHGGTAA